MTKKRFVYAIYVALIIVAGIISSISPYFYKLLVDAIPSQNYQRLLNIVFIYMGVVVASLLVSEICFWIGNYVLIDAAIKVREAAFEWVQKLDFIFHANKSTGSIISAFKRGDSAFFDFSFIIHHKLLDIFISFAVMFYFFIRLDPRIAVITLVSVVLTLIATKFLIENNVAKRDAFNDEEDKVTDIITDNLINYETVKLFAKENWELKRLKEAFIPWRRRLWTFSNSYRTIDFTIGTIINVGIVSILLFSIKATTNLKMDLGDFVLVAAFIAAIFPRLWDLVWSLRDIARSYSDIQKYFGLLNYTIDVKDPEKPILLKNVKGNIEFDRVSFSYKDGKKDALKSFSLKIHKGESVALVGRSGSGKTTLIKLLMRFFDVNSGAIKIGSINIKDLTKKALRSLMGVVPQEPILFNSTIAYNIGYGKENATLGEIKAAATLANIDEFIESLPRKYETQVGERGVKLSGGQKQRLAIARMILSNPDIIIFDEATSHLDSESEKLIQDAFWKVASGKTTIIIAHRLSTVARADRIVVLEDGHIKEIGSHKELLEKKDGLYKHFWDLQIKLD